MTTNKKPPHIPEAEELPGDDPNSVWASWADPKEVDTFDEFVRRFWKKELSPDEFKLFRLQNGVYGQVQEGVQMVRIKVPAGGLSAEQLDLLGDLARQTPRGVGHVTTRQNLQFHFVPLAQAAEVLGKLNAVGLTTREACANTIRTITACHRSGICPTEAFDVSCYATAVSHYFLRNPLNQNLPRKLKMSFSGCPKDCALPVMHDIGMVAALRAGSDGKERRGFEVYLGGGLGAQPRAARLLEEFTPAEDLLVTLAAVVRIFDRHGNRQQKMMARMKFIIDKLGWEAFQKMVLQERGKLKLTMTVNLPPIKVWEESPGAGAPGAGSVLEMPSAPAPGPAYPEWFRTCVMVQKQKQYALVHVRLDLGDIKAEALKALAAAARRFSNGTVRTTAQQNFAIRWVPLALLPQLYELLSSAGLAKPNSERLADVTCCPGGDTCQLGITSSRGMTRALTEKFDDLKGFAEMTGVRIKISGCPNSCGQHHLASIGLFGGARKFGDKMAPTYQMMLGGSLGNFNAKASPFSKAFLKIPAANVTDAIVCLLGLYQDNKRDDESFNAFLERYGWEKLKAEMASYAEIPSYEQAPGKYKDVATALEEVGGLRDDFKLHVGKGECAT